jgi:glycosyltransferase involved in cell wall biosynthesis
VPSERVSVEYCGVDLAAWPAEPEPGDAAVCREHGAQPGRFVLCVGDADWRKNADGTAAACGIAQRDLPELRLLWAGKLSGDREQALRALAQQHGVALELLGFVPDEQLQALYRSALCTVFASRAEGFGYPVLEGMAIGCPVVTSNVSSMPEVAGNGALCVDPEAPAAIAEAIVRLARDGELRANLRERGFARARELTLDKQAEAMLALYTQLGRAAN